MGVTDDDIIRWNKEGNHIYFTIVAVWVFGLIAVMCGVSGLSWSSWFLGLYLELSVLGLGFAVEYSLRRNAETDRVLSMAVDLARSGVYGNVDGVLHRLDIVIGTVATRKGAFVYVELDIIGDSGDCTERIKCIWSESDLCCFRDSLSEADKARYKLSGLIK